MSDAYLSVTNEVRRQRYATDEDYRLRILNQQRARRDSQARRQRERYRTDPEYRQRCIERARERQAKGKTVFPKRIDRKSHREQQGKRCPAHLAWVRGFACSVPGCDGRPIEAAHYRGSMSGGMGLKPSDRWAWSACHDHHAEQHQIGEASFAQKHGLDLEALCNLFAKKSPHAPKLREMV